MKKLIFTLFCGTFFLTGCATSNKHLLSIDSTPSDALISVHDTIQGSSTDIRKIAGTTPVEKHFDFGKNGRLWLELEKRGYVSQMIEVTPETNKYFIRLERMKNKDGQNVKEYIFPEVNRVLLAMPDIKVIHRGFSGEGLSEEKTRTAGNQFLKGIDAFISGKYEVATVKSPDDEQLLKTIWRDTRTAMDLVDPIRACLGYF